MHDVEIDRYPTISTSACVRSGLTRRPIPPEPAASQPESARAAPLRSRTDLDPMPSGTFIRSATSTFPIGDVVVGIGSRLLAPARAPNQKVIFRPERRLRPRRRDVHRRSKSRSDAERHARALPAHHARSARPPLGIGGTRSHRRSMGLKRVSVHTDGYKRKLLAQDTSNPASSLHPCNRYRAATANCAPVTH